MSRKVLAYESNQLPPSSPKVLSQVLGSPVPAIQYLTHAPGHRTNRRLLHRGQRRAYLHEQQHPAHLGGRHDMPPLYRL